MRLQTEHLLLEPVSVELATAVAAGDLSSVRPGPGWPHDGTKGGMWMVTSRGAQIWLFTLDGNVIGDGGALGPADDTGVITIGCGLAEGFEDYEAEAMAAIGEHFRGQDGITEVVALSAEAAGRIDHRPPQADTGEHGTLAAFVHYLRTCIIAKLDDVSGEDARRTSPSGNSLLWVVKHCARAEESWLEEAFLGNRPSIVRSERLTEADTPESVQELCRRVGERCDQIMAEHTDMDEEAANADFRGERTTLRWIMIHLVEELGRHAGHADIMREQVDGRTGR